MQLAICTDVFADLSYTEMLDKVKALGIDAVEMTAGAGAPVSTATQPNCWRTPRSLKRSKVNWRRGACALLP